MNTTRITRTHPEERCKQDFCTRANEPRSQANETSKPNKQNKLQTWANEFLGITWNLCRKWHKPSQEAKPRQSQHSRCKSPAQPKPASASLSQPPDAGCGAIPAGRYGEPSGESLWEPRLLGTKEFLGITQGFLLDSLVLIDSLEFPESLYREFPY